MQHIFPFIHIERNPKDAKTSEKAETTSKEALKSTDSFLSRGEDFCIAVRTSRPNRIWSYDFNHLSRVFETTLSVLNYNLESTHECHKRPK
jgi:hypothetical protein